MNKFRILGVIAIIAIIANFFGGLDENWRDFKKGFEDGHNSAMEIYEPGRHIIPHHATSVKLNVEPLPETTVDSLSNNRVDWTLPYTVTEIETYAKPSAWHILVMGLAIPGIFLFLIGFCSLIRLLISISRREVFTSANVRRLRWFAYTSASLEILIAVDEWIVGNAAVEQISLTGRFWYLLQWNLLYQVWDKESVQKRNYGIPVHLKCLLLGKIKMYYFISVLWTGKQIFG